jgi:hypothetical protein
VSLYFASSIRMKAKIARALKLFEIFGLHFEDSKFSKYVRNFWFFFLTFLVLQSIYRGLTSKHFSGLDFRDYLIQYTVHFEFIISAFVIFLLTFKLRKVEQKILTNLTEVDELIAKSLRIKIDYSRFNRELFWKISFQILIMSYMYDYKKD